MMTKKCKVCSAPVIGRTDKKFCSIYCKSAYHNRVQSISNNFVRRTDAILKRNRRTLKKFLTLGIDRVSRQDLIANGFCFKHFTSKEKQMEKKVFFCYEFGYASCDAENYLLSHHSANRKDQLRKIEEKPLIYLENMKKRQGNA